MITVNHDTAPGVLELTVEGRVTEADMEVAMVALEKRAAQGHKLKVLEDIVSLNGMTPAALWQDLRRGLPLMDDISHVAVVTDEEWIRSVTDMAKVLPVAEVRTFDRSRLDEAREWLASA